MSELQKRLLKMACSTLTGKRAQGYFLPYRYADQVPAQEDPPVYSALEKGFSAAREGFRSLLQEAVEEREIFRAFEGAVPPNPRWEQSWFPGLDGACAYLIVKRFRPKRIIEVGSGHSTRFLCKALRDGDIPCHFTAIDPCPRAEIKALGVEAIPRMVQMLSPSYFESLEGGDILFIDSSHLLLAGSDVDYLLNRVIPLLPSGVLIHFHDVFLPDAYPADWSWRGYNEQQGIIPLLTFGNFKILWSSAYVRTRMAEEVACLEAFIPLEDEAREGSLWIARP